MGCFEVTIFTDALRALGLSSTCDFVPRLLLDVLRITWSDSSAFSIGELSCVLLAGGLDGEGVLGKELVLGLKMPSLNFPIPIRLRFPICLVSVSGAMLSSMRYCVVEAVP